MTVLVLLQKQGYFHMHGKNMNIRMEQMYLKFRAHFFTQLTDDAVP